MASDDVVRQQLLFLLQGGGAHMSLEQAVADFPEALMNSRPPQVPYTFWHLLEHIRIAQWDIIDFCRNPQYQALSWPEGYWPHPDATATPERWQQTVKQITADTQLLSAMLHDSATDLYADLPHAAEYTLLREMLLAADHNAYHLGEFCILRQVMNAWV